MDWVRTRVRLKFEFAGEFLVSGRAVDFSFWLFSADPKKMRLLLRSLLLLGALVYYAYTLQLAPMTCTHNSVVRSSCDASEKFLAHASAEQFERKGKTGREQSDQTVQQRNVWKNQGNIDQLVRVATSNGRRRLEEKDVDVERTFGILLLFNGWTQLCIYSAGV